MACDLWGKLMFMGVSLSCQQWQESNQRNTAQGGKVLQNSAERLMIKTHSLCRVFCNPLSLKDFSLLVLRERRTLSGEVLLCLLLVWICEVKLWVGPWDADIQASRRVFNLSFSVRRLIALRKKEKYGFSHRALSDAHILECLCGS